MDKALNAAFNLAKFIGVIVVPVTLWFLVLRQDVIAAQNTIIEIQQVQKTRDERYRELREKSAEQYAIIIRELGEIRGELKRIKY